MCQQNDSTAKFPGYTMNVWGEVKGRGKKYSEMTMLAGLMQYNVVHQHLAIGCWALGWVKGNVDTLAWVEASGCCL